MRMILAGDVNLMNVTDPSAPFALVADELRAADLAFANLECCLYRPPQAHSVDREGFYADPQTAGEALTSAGFAAVGVANNVNYGAAAILASISRLDRLGIAHTGAGADRAAARAPAIVECGGLRVGFLQRSSVYWPTDHEAGEKTAGIATIRGHTAYQVPTSGSRPPANRPGVPPVVVTWADKAYLEWLADDIAALRTRVDIAVASFHWGLNREVLQYMTEIGHAAIDAGADLVIGHGPHFSLPVEIYNGKPIFYGLGSFSFHTGHGGRKHGDWLGMMAAVSWQRGRLERVGFRFVRHDDRNRTVLRRLADENPASDEIARDSAAFGTSLAAAGDEVQVVLRA
jgi:poly-gamma-glutamate capsule biosynthesis protein CapA/YwtB (metallophosphatase superfamily)